MDEEKGQIGNANLKIPTFFPDSWAEEKVRACALLSFVGTTHQMSDQKSMASPGGATFYPNPPLSDPGKPA